VRSPSEWLRRAAPDGRLDPGSARFVDALPILLAAAGALLLAAAASRPLRAALAGAWNAPPAGSRPWRSIPALAIAAGALRLVISRISDQGLGDDGARVVWLERWLRHPEPIWSGYWAPGHLYIQALLRLVVGDSIRAGILLSALAATGTAWILARRAESVWGRASAVLVVCFAGLSPVSVAYGATPDVNPVFAFAVVASVAAARRATSPGRTGPWLAVSWIAFAVAAWSRFEAFLLAPAVALALWPRRRTALVHGASLLVPTLVWSLGDWLSTGQAARVVSAVSHDPALQGSRAALLFTYSGAWWQGLGLPLVVLAPFGVARALRSRAAREWIPVVLLHLSALTAAMWTSGTGTQARYFILDGALLGFYAAAALGGVLDRSRRAGAALAVAALALLAWTPGLYSGEGHLWACRDAGQRALVDAVRARAGEDHVLWIAGGSAYFYACRTRIPIERYHAMGRSDDSPERVLAELRDAAADGVLVCVDESPRALAQWRAIGDGWPGDVEAVEPANGYRLFRMTAPGAAR
jgi:hypothetical protein